MIYPKGRTIIPIEFQSQFPLISEEIYGQPSVFKDPGGFLSYLSDVILKLLDAQVVEAPSYKDHICSAQRCSFIMYECVLCQIGVILQFQSSETSILNRRKVALYQQCTLCSSYMYAYVMVCQCYDIQAYVKTFLYIFHAQWKIQRGTRCQGIMSFKIVFRAFKMFHSQFQVSLCFCYPGYNCSQEVHLQTPSKSHQ